MSLSIFEELLLSKGDYQISLESHSELASEDFALKVGNDTIAFQLKKLKSDSSERWLVSFSLEEDYARVSLELVAQDKEALVFLGIQREVVSNPFRSDFYDYHYSLHDHVKQMDTVLRFTEGTDELSTLFNTLRGEMATNIAALRVRIEALEQELGQPKE